MNPLDLIDRYYPPGDPAREILIEHSRQVATKAVAIARRVAEQEPVDLVFVEEAALLHDIGIRFVHAPDIGCHGPLPYLAHGCKGRDLLDSEGLPRHGLICERHIGVGLTAAEIRAQKLPLPERDMFPVSIEEMIVTYADLFFSKTPGSLDLEKPIERVRQSLSRYGANKVAIFDAWHTRFG